MNHKTKAKSWSYCSLRLRNGCFPIRYSAALKPKYPPSWCADTFLAKNGTDSPAVSDDDPARAPITGHYHLEPRAPTLGLGVRS